MLLWTELEKVFERQQTGMLSNNLFAYPLESNFSGIRYNPSLVTAIQRHLDPPREESTDPQEDSDRQGAGSHDTQRWWVLLDAAKGCTTKPPDLGHSKPHFVVSPFSPSDAGCRAVWMSCLVGTNRQLYKLQSQKDLILTVGLVAGIA